MVKIEGAAAECTDGEHVVRNEQDGGVVSKKCFGVFHALALKFEVADRKDFIDQQNVGQRVSRDRESEPHVHAA